MILDFQVLFAILFIVSLCSNFILIWFLRSLTSRLVYVSENMTDLLNYLTEYGSDLKSIYEMEMYYGDETIKGLIRHTQMIMDVLSDFDEIYNITNDEGLEEVDEEELEEEDELDESTEPDKNTEEEEEGQKIRKAVFYGGT